MTAIWFACVDEAYILGVKITWTGTSNFSDVWLCSSF